MRWHAFPRQISSARDQLTGQPVAVKKIMKPFSTPVLSKRTYRELKLLKHLRHENVGQFTRIRPHRSVRWLWLDHQPKWYFHFSPRRHVCPSSINFKRDICCLTDRHSYFVTELLGTDLHRLLTSRPLEKQFIQYFLYQILVRGCDWLFQARWARC